MLRIITRLLSRVTLWSMAGDLYQALADDTAKVDCMARGRGGRPEPAGPSTVTSQGTRLHVMFCVRKACILAMHAPVAGPADIFARTE